MTTFVTIASGTLGIACFAFMPLTERWPIREFLFWTGLGLVLISASFAALKENHKRRRRNRLGDFIGRALSLANSCDNEYIDFDQTKTAVDTLRREQNEYVKRQFGSGAMAHMNNDEGVEVRRSGRLDRERREMADWCRLRAARLSEMIGPVVD